MNVVSLDAASTASARRGLELDRLRIGAGLFGARLGAPVDTRCAIRVRAPVMRRFAPGSAAFAGYGDVAIPRDRAVAVLRCGYGDGFPAALADRTDVLAVGMQYVTRVVRDGADPAELIGADDDVDALASRAGVGSHALITSLGAGACGGST